MASAESFIEPTSLPGVYLIKRPKFDDERGFFHEIYRHSELHQISGLDFKPLQANHSHSNRSTLRGIHIAPWHKLVTVLHGEVQQVVVDARRDSPTFGQYLSVILNDQDPQTVLIPGGCGNAFLVLSKIAEYMYLTSEEWTPNREVSLAYNDPDLNIAWQLSELTVSERDRNNKHLRDL